MDKKSAKIGIGDAENPTSKMHEEVGLKKFYNTSIDSVLANEMLVSIFEFLPAADLMRLELVSKKWNRLASKWAWRNYTIVSFKQFPGCYKWKNAYSKFNSLFLRCGQFIKELDFSILMESRSTRDHLCALLSLLPNLQHLNANDISLSSADLTLISDTFTSLISLRLMCVRSESIAGIKSVLNKCKKLEILQIGDIEDFVPELYYFVVLPPSLKCVYFGVFCDDDSFFQQLVKQGIQLESLGLADWPGDLSSFCAISFDRLKYFSIKMDKSVLNDFVQLVEKLLHLEALELDIFAGTGQTWTDELFEVISHKCPGLKHFGLNLFYDSTVKDEKFALLASLPNLCSVQVHSRCRAARIPILMLFEKLSLSGRLQYFNTSEVLFPEDVCQGLMRCRNLTQIFCGRDELRRDQQQKGFDSVLATLRIIHEGEQLPAAASDARILHTNFGKRSKRTISIIHGSGFMRMTSSFH